MIGLDIFAARPLLGAHALRTAVWDEVAAPVQVTLSPHGTASTVFGDILRGIPSGIARIAVSGGNYWKPDQGFEANANAWDDSAGGAPSATVYFLNGSRQRFTGLQSIDVRGGALRRGVSAPLHRSWLRRVFALGADPAAGQVYTDAATVLAVQQQLLARGFTDAKGNPIKPDGIMGKHTAAAIRKLQAALGAGQSGVIDEGVLMALGVSAPASAAAAPEPPADGRPGKGWSQPMPEAMGPAVTPTSPGGAAGEIAAVSAAPVSKGVFVAIAGAVIVIAGGLLLIFTGGKKRR